MQEREYKNLKRQIEKDCQTKLAALDLVYRLSAKSSNSFVSYLVRDAVKAIEGDFTLKQVFEYCSANTHDEPVRKASVAVAMKRMSGKGINVIKAGKGRQATIYRKGEDNALTLVV